MAFDPTSYVPVDYVPPDWASERLRGDPGFDGYRRRLSDRARLIRQDKPRPIKRGSR